MNRTFYVSARENAGNGIVAREVTARDFAGAQVRLHDLARQQFGAADYRVTNVTEIPDFADGGPIRRVIAITLEGADHA